MKNIITTAQDKIRNKVKGNPTSDKQFVEIITLIRHQGLLNLGARKNGTQKNNQLKDNK